MIVRLYESMRKHTVCELKTAMPVVEVIKTNMLENGNEQINCLNKKIKRQFNSSEMITLSLKIKK